MIRFLLIAVMLVLVGCGRAADQVGEATRPPAEVIETDVSRTQTARTTVIVPTLVPTRAAAPTTAPTEAVPPTDVPPTASATVEPPTPTDIPTVTPLPTAAPTETVAPTDTVAPTPEPTPTTVEPSATVTEALPTATGEPNIDPLPGDFLVIPWEGLIIPIPDGYDDRTADDEELLNGAPVEAKLEVAPSDDAEGEDDDKESDIAPMVYTIVRYSEGSAGWLDVVRARDDGKRAIDERSVTSVTVAGYPGQSYEPRGSGNDKRLNYVVELDADRLLLITIDQDDPEQSRAIPFIERDADSVATPETTTTPLAEEQLSSELAYLLDGDIWLHDLRSAKSSQLTELGTVREFTWSPDGRRIAFSAGDENDTNIWTVDVPNGKQQAMTEGAEADMFPAYGSDGRLFFLRRSVGDEATTIDIVKHEDGEDMVVHSEPGGLVGPTALRFRNEHEWALAVSTGRGRYVLLGELGDDTSKDLAETYLPTVAGCAYDIAWREREAVVLSSIDCIPHENVTISRIDLENPGSTPAAVHTGAGITSVDWAADGMIAWSRSQTGSQSDGIWVITDDNEPVRVLEEGLQPMWRP